MYQLYRDQPLLLFALVVTSVVLSAWCIHNDPVINNDGVTYLAMAQYMAEGKWAAAFDYYSWPYYSVFVVATAKLLFVDIETAAYLLNTLFATLLVLAYVSIVGELSNNNRRILLIAVVLILFFPSINKYRSFIIRDFGYLSCYLWSLYFIFRFCRTFNKAHLAGWLVFAMLSCLFRFEGIVFLLIAPYFLLLFAARNLPHRRAILLSLSSAIVVASAILVFWYVNDKYSAMLAMATINGQDITGITDLFLENIKQRLGERALTPVNYTLVIIANIGDVFYELFRRMAGFYLLFVIYAYFKGPALSDELQRRVWLVFVATNLVVLLGFSLFNNFLVSRYTLATALTLLLIAPFAIDHLWQKAFMAGPVAKTTAVAVIVVLVGISLDRLAETTNKMHLKNAGQWLAESAKSNQAIYSNDKLIIYYAARSPSENLDHLYSTDMLIEFLETNQLRNYDYLAFNLDNKIHAESLLRQTLTYHLGRPVFIEDAGNQRYVFVFDVRQRYERSTG